MLAKPPKARETGIHSTPDPIISSETADLDRGGISPTPSSTFEQMSSFAGSVFSQAVSDAVSEPSELSRLSGSSTAPSVLQSFSPGSIDPRLAGLEGKPKAVLNLKLCESFSYEGFF